MKYILGGLEAIQPPLPAGRQVSIYIINSVNIVHYFVLKVNRQVYTFRYAMFLLY